MYDVRLDVGNARRSRLLSWRAGVKREKAFEREERSQRRRHRDCLGGAEKRTRGIARGMNGWEGLSENGDGRRVVDERTINQAAV